MCGIVAAVAQRDISHLLIQGLHRLEYRGYDSAGIAVLNTQQKIQRIRAVGKVAQLETLTAEAAMPGFVGIAHTRWATHGAPCEENAHPHVSQQDIAVVHNGIIENFQAIKKRLLEQGYDFVTETDTESIAHLIHYHTQQDQDFLTAVQTAVTELKGAYAFAVLHEKEPGRIIVARHGAPLVIGLGHDENFAASDPFALLPITNTFIYLEEGDVAEIQQQAVFIYDATGKRVERQQHDLDMHCDASEKGEYRHYMRKEIAEQADVIYETLNQRITQKNLAHDIFPSAALELFSQVKHVQIVACGTSYHAGLIARHWLEELAGIHCHVEIASEFRYRKNRVLDNTLFVAISQSGETADTLAALQLAKTLPYLTTLAICNVPESSLVRGSDFTLLTKAGIEIGVASTKAFSTQLTALLLLTIVLGKYAQMDAKKEQMIVEVLHRLPVAIQRTLQLDETIQHIAEKFADKQHALFLGRGAHYPVALEGALKLKEISYIHAEAYPAGELKHGPLALVDKDMPVIAVAPNDELFEKLLSNLHEVRARGGQLIVFAAQESIFQEEDEQVHVIPIPHVDKIIAPIIYTIPLQLLAYHVAVLKGTDVDQPRNLAKSVTVE